MFSPEAPRPSLVDTATTTGRPARSRLLAARVTGVSDSPAASRARVAPVQGAITRASAMCLGPRGSTPVRVSSTGRPAAASSLAFQPAALPNRVSVEAAAKLITGITCQPRAASRAAWGTAAPKVQKLPHRAKATVPICCPFIPLPPVLPAPG